MAGPDRELIAHLREGLAGVGDPDRATGMQAYLKSSMPLFGVPKPQRRALLRGLLAEHRFADRETWERTVITLWDEATRREERYCAIDLTGVREARPWQDPTTLPLYEHLIVTGAWWDLVDDVAIRRVGPMLRTHAAETVSVLYRWARDRDRWRRRSAIIAQVQSKDATYVDLLAACIEPNLEDTDLFIRKSVGWALREYSKCDPDWVRWFVTLHAGRISALSRREALRRLANTTEPVT